MRIKPMRETLTAAVRLAPEVSVNRALTTMIEANADFGVVVRPDGKCLGLISKTRLASMERPVKLSKIFAVDPPPLVVGAEVHLEKAIPGLASHFNEHPELEGAIVDLNTMKFVSRKTVLNRARSNQVRRVLDQLEGSPLDLVFYRCPKDGEVQMLNYYTGHAPLCSAGHTMDLIE